MQYPILAFNKNKRRAKRKYLIPVFGRPGVGKTTLIYSIIKKEPEGKALYGSNDENMKIYENENVISNLSFIEINEPTINCFNTNLEIIIDKICSIIKKQFNTNEPENYADCIWYCISGSRFEAYELNLTTLLMNKFKEIPFVLVYTLALDIKLANSCKEYFKERYNNIDFISVLAKRVEFSYRGSFLKPHGIDILLKETIKKCENRRKNEKNH